MSSRIGSHQQISDTTLASKALVALGIVFGDIGTSPLYALRECFNGPHALPLTSSNIYGVLSLIVWSLVMVISIKYASLVLRADNKGEGGILALMSLASDRSKNQRVRGLGFVTVLGLIGATLMYGDGAVTPAISVLSAIEGLNVATPLFEPYVVVIAALILVLFFASQSRGTAKIGKTFGPIILLWFSVLALLGIKGIIAEPSILKAIDPRYAISFFSENSWFGFAALGSVFLVVTGGEALYADLGHFGRRSIRAGWFCIVLPGLLLQYFGQGALLLSDSSSVVNPFYLLAPEWALYPMVALATLATIIASQAMLTGAFSISAQAVQLGYLPRIEVRHTSAREKGQIYVPLVNWLLLAGCLFLVFEFKSSSKLAAAYGIAVTGTMLITTMLMYVVMRRRWGWSYWSAIPTILAFLVIDLSFLGANALKFWDGGWFPVSLGALIFILMTSWKSGRRVLGERLAEVSQPLEDFFAKVVPTISHRKSGTAVFMTGSSNGAPSSLIQNVKHNGVLHEKVILMTISTEETPHVAESERITITNEGHGFYRVIAHYGFMESPHVPEILTQCGGLGLEVDIKHTTFYLGRETLVSKSKFSMAIWRQKVFIFMMRNSKRATDYFKIPSDQAIEIGTVVEI